MSCLTHLITKSILSIAGYSSKDNIVLKKEFDNKTENDKKMLLGLLIYLLIKTGNIFTTELPSKYANYADKRSDLIPMIRILCDYYQNETMKPKNISPSFGVDFQKAFSIYEYMNNFINDVFRFNNNKNAINTKQVSYKLKKYVEKLANTDKLYDFIQQFLFEIQREEPEFINSRRDHFTNIQTDKKIMVFVGNDSTIYCKICNGLISPSKKADGFLLNLSKDCINNKVDGSIFHLDQSFCLSGSYPYPWLEENENKKITNDMIINYANIIFQKSNNSFGIYIKFICFNTN